MAYTQVTVTTSPTLIVAANNSRRQLIVDNQGSTNSVYFGPNTSIASNNTVKLLPGANLTSDGNAFLGSLYGVTSAGSSVVGVWEWP